MLLTPKNLDCNSHNLGAVTFVDTNAPSDGPLVDISESPLTKLILHDDLTWV